MNYNNNKLTAPKQNPLGYKDMPVGRSAVNKSRTTWNQALFGALMPVDCIKTYPNSTTEISYDLLIQSRYPLVRELKTPIRVYLHSYLCYDKNVWEGAKRHVDAGLNGNINLDAPKFFYLMTPDSRFNFTNTSLNTIHNDTAGTNAIIASNLSLYSPLAFMEGLVGTIKTPTISPTPDVNTFYKNQINYVSHRINGVNNPDATIITKLYDGGATSTKLEINAIKLAHYIRICRDYYFNTNLLMSNKSWYPDDEEEFMLPYNSTKAINWNNGTEISAGDFTGYVNRLNKKHPLVYGTQARAWNVNPISQMGLGGSNIPNTTYWEGNGTGYVSEPMLNALYFRQFEGDYFTASSPFKDLIRGNAPKLNFDFDDSTADLFAPPNSSLTPNLKIMGTGTYEGTMQTTSPTEADALKDFYKKLINHSSIDMSRLRKLQVMQAYAEKNATINQADYHNGFLKAQFNYNPKQDEKKPIYIGGCYFDIVNNTVVNQSLNSTTSANPNQPNYLGQKTSNLISANNGYIGKAYSEYYGYIITIMSVVPQTIYNSSGLDRELNIIHNEDIFLPIKEKLDPMPIFNKELKISGNTSDDNDIFSYSSRYEYAKGRRNRADGLVKVLSYDKAQFLYRNFTSTPTFNNFFVTISPVSLKTDNVFQNDVEPPFDYQLNSNVDQILPMSAIAQPSNLGL